MTKWQTEIPKTSDQIDKCFKEGVDECEANCKEVMGGGGGGMGGGTGGGGGMGGGSSNSGCHDTLGCEPDDCSGGTPSVCSIDNLSTIQNLKSKIDSENQTILGHFTTNEATCYWGAIDSHHTSSQQF